MFNFSIMGLDETHIDEHCEDIKKLRSKRPELIFYKILLS